MSGHSKWASIKHKKAAVDAQKGRVFTKMIREITVAVKHGGDNIDSNIRLRKAIDEAKNCNMPAENIKRAIQRGTGELPGVSYEEILYEGYGPAGVAVMANILTDNKNRTAAELRKIFQKYGGNMGEAGCVSWMFSSKGLIYIGKKRISEEDLMSVALDAGAEDIQSDDENFFHVVTSAHDMEKVKKAIEKIGIDKSEVTMLPKNYIKLEGHDAEQMMKMMNELDEHEDVQSVYANFDISEEEMQKAVL